MSICRDFTPEELAIMLPWQLPDIGLEADEANSEKEALVPMLTAEEIETIQKQAYDEAATQGHQDGYRDGQKKGYEEGYQQGCKAKEAELLAQQQELQAQQQALQEQQQAFVDERREYGKRLDQLLIALESPLAELDEQVEQELVSLTVAIAKQVVRRELHIDSGQIVATVRSAVGALPSATRDISLHLHPDDAALVKEALALHDTGMQWKIIEDPLISNGGCRVSSEFSSVDATVENRLAQLIAKVLGDDREAAA